LNNNYLQRYAFFSQKITASASGDLAMVIVIPARREEDLVLTLESVFEAKKPAKPFEIIVVFNHPENEDEKSKKINFALVKQCEKWIKDKEYDNVFCIKAFDLPKKHAGVGLARKIGMDEAVRRLKHNDNGLIVALDADCLLAENYLQSIENHFTLNPDCNAASIYFEHRLEGLNTHLKKGIIQYELHLRYYNQLLNYAGHPFAYHTVGSSMVVRSFVYQKQGGMNKRKAGEDFYFLQKIIQLGNFGEIKNTVVYPSSRISDRVPFGTGRAQGEWESGTETVLLSYHPQVGEVLKMFFQYLENKASKASFEHFPESIQQFIGVEEWNKRKDEIVHNTKTEKAFIQRFYLWFNLFMCFKFVHFYRDNIQANIPIIEAANELAIKLGMDSCSDTMELLTVFREWERR
jgi:hypothetical protein